MAQATDPARGLAGARLLVVDDEFMIALDLETVFRDAGAATVSVCSTLEEGLDAVRAEAFDAAVLDIRLGAETTEPIAVALAGRGVPFLFYSGQAMPETMSRRLGGASILAKPAREAVLVGAVRRLLGAKPAS